MRTRFRWLGLGLLSALALTGCQKAEDKVTQISVGDTSAYKALAQLPTMHDGRIKPIDTVAREEVKLIYTRETINLPSEDGKVVTSWTPIAAFLDWSVRPKFWDNQPIIAVEYLPLKQFILADEVRGGIESVASKTTTTEPDRARLKDLLKNTDIDSRSIRDVVRVSKLAIEDGKKLLKLADRIGEATKWLSPDDLETSQIMIDGKPSSFLEWLDGITRRAPQGPMTGGKPKLTDLEQKGFEVGVKLAHYRAIRDKQPMTPGQNVGPVQILAMPRPPSKAMLEFTGAAYNKAKTEGPRSLDPFEFDTAVILHEYLENVPNKDKAAPGENREFDAKYTRWLDEKSAWVPLAMIRDVPVDELARAGYPSAKVEAFRSAFKAFEDAEMANPGRIADAPALALVDSANDLGMAANPARYPKRGWMSSETHFNSFAPFYKAPFAYLAASVLLILSLSTRSYVAPENRIAGFGSISKACYVTGVASFASGIALEAYGFALRVWISGWAPVTNMYETVIWVAMVLSILGFVLEITHRKTYAALAGSLVALLGTTLAATVPMLDSKIPYLPPVLRSNYWLGIHVLTIVSSYGAFALAWGLGKIAMFTYLTATYRRTASLGELASPLLPGLPLLAAGVFGCIATYGGYGVGPTFESVGFYPSLAIGCIGGVLSATAIIALIGEAINRATFPHFVNARVPEASGVEGTEAFRQGMSTSAIAATYRPDDAARAKAMQATAAKIKPMANFIYRSMQVGILLVALGTFLGGWWADVSWGRFWGWDPKEVWALITLVVYLIPLHGRFAGWVNTFWLVMASGLCFCSVLMAWYGVNFVLGVGLHSYGFVEGKGQGVVGVATLVFLSIGAGTFWRRHLSSIVRVA